MNISGRILFCQLAVESPYSLPDAGGAVGAWLAVVEHAVVDLCDLSPAHPATLVKGLLEYDNFVFIFWCNHRLVSELIPVVYEHRRKICYRKY